jgi:hypothetical protein
MHGTHVKQQREQDGPGMHDPGDWLTASSWTERPRRPAAELHLAPRTTGGGPAASEPVRRELYGRWIAGQWSDVQVCGAELVARLRRGAGQRAKVRAVVQLGGLTPADVVVTARSVDPALERATEEVVRLWSVQSHHNGAFVFEAAANASAIDDAADLLVTVEPARALPGDRVLPSAMRIVAPSRPDDCTTCTHV